LDRPHGTLAAGLIVIAAGAYELTSRKRRFCQRCRETLRLGFVFGIECVGSSIDWMVVIATIITAQELLPLKAALDVPLALAIITFGVVITVDLSLVPGLAPPM
jgi:predicted metal-binding membrane protein